MENVSFDDNQNKMFATRKPGMAEWLMAHSGGAVRNRIQAVGVLLGIVALLVIVSVFVWYEPPLRLSVEEERMFVGKTPAERLKVPHMIDQTLFK